MAGRKKWSVFLCRGDTSEQWLDSFHFHGCFPFGRYISHWNGPVLGDMLVFFYFSGFFAVFSLNESGVKQPRNSTPWVGMSFLYLTCLIHSFWEEGCFPTKEGHPGDSRTNKGPCSYRIPAVLVVFFELGEDELSTITWCDSFLQYRHVSKPPPKPPSWKNIWIGLKTMMF